MQTFTYADRVAEMLYGRTFQQLEGNGNKFFSARLC